MAAGKVIAVANQKGGVGKTTTAVNLSSAVARLGHRVLLLDFDPQGNAGSSLGVDPSSPSPDIYDVIAGDALLSEAILPAEVPGLFVVAARPDLAGAEVELVGMSERESVLRDALIDDASQFDLVVIDCPPSLSLLTVNALVAATDGVLVPVQTEYLPLEGLTHLVDTLDAIRSRLNPGLRIVGILMTMYDARTNLSAEVVAELRAHFPELVFQEVIPRSVRLSEAPSRGESIFAYAPASAGAISYRLVAEELVQRLGLASEGD